MAGGNDARAGRCSICSSPAELRCAGCKEIAYCSKEHQKMDWKKHKNFCKAFEVKNSDQLGRYLVATRDLKPGDLIMTDTPLAFAPKSLPDTEYVAPCVGCYKPVGVDVGERCNSCGWPICSGLCPGLKDFRHHGLECVVLSMRGGCAVSNIGDYYRHDSLMTLRCLLAQKKFPKKYKKILDLQSHMKERGPGTAVYNETHETVVKYLEDNFLHNLRAVETELNTNVLPDISTKLLHTICGVIDVNSLDLRLNNGGTELTALYANFSLMEHSCIPNTKHSFDIDNDDENLQFKVVVRAVVPIMKGENITTMYTHALWGTQARREHLKESKYFNCFCSRCKDPTELGTYLSALKCLGTETETCTGIQLPVDPCDPDTDWGCDSCPVKVKSSEILYLIMQMGDEVEAVQAEGPNIQQLEDLVTKLSTFLHPNHYHLYSVKHSLVQLYGYQQGCLYHQMDDDLLLKKADMCKTLINITLKIDPGNSRLSLYSSVLYHELFQAEFQLAKRKLDRKGVTRNDIGEMAKYLKDHLKKAIAILDDENEGSPGGRLLEVMKDSQKTLLKWIKDNYIQ